MLDNVANDKVCTFSGGMKRRLSLVISTIGDPKIIFLDEPSKGMDPISRRYVWSFLEKFKKDRVIVLLTNSLEEADVLGDRIAFLAQGKLSVIGNSIQLKSKFGKGYRISIVSEPGKSIQVKELVATKVPDAVLEDDSAEALIYQVPSKSTDSIPLFIRCLTEENTGLVKNWGISQTTLEEVFLNRLRETPTDIVKKEQ